MGDARLNSLKGCQIFSVEFSTVLGIGRMQAQEGLWHRSKMALEDTTWRTSSSKWDTSIRRHGLRLRSTVSSRPRGLNNESTTGKLDENKYY